MALTSHSGSVGCTVFNAVHRFSQSLSKSRKYRNAIHQRHGDMHGDATTTQAYRPINTSISLQWLSYVLLCAALLIGASFFTKAVAADEVYPPGGTHNGEDVAQPIEFPHNIHVKDNKINCMYCHTYARRSKVAGIPPTSKCMGCHKTIATDKERIIKLTQYWENKEPPPWKKVHDVPDFVHFTHEKHLKKFVFDRDYPVENVKEVCAFCHGEVENMTVAHKVKPLNMGWCKSCHEANGGPGDCWKCHK